LNGYETLLDILLYISILRKTILGNSGENRQCAFRIHSSRRSVMMIEGRADT